MCFSRMPSKITVSTAEAILSLSACHTETDAHTQTETQPTLPPLLPLLFTAASIIQILSCLFQTAGSSLTLFPLSCCLSRKIQTG